MNKTPEPRQVSFKLKLLLLAVVLLCGVFGIRNEIAHVQQVQGVALNRNVGDVDEGPLTNGMQSAKNWSEASKWWSGRWVYGTAYYRPLASYAMWMQHQAFGDNGFAQFKAVLLVLHLIVVALVFLLFYELLGPGMATIAAAVWALGVLGWFGFLGPWYALQHWKDQPEMMVTIPYLASLWCILKYSRTERKGFAVAAMGLFLGALLFKELAYSLPLVMIALLWREDTAEKHMNLIITFLAVAAVTFAGRCLIIGSMGETYGDVGINQTYFLRWIRMLAGEHGLAAAKSGVLGWLALAASAALVAWRMKGNRDWCLALLFVALTYLPLTMSAVTAHAMYLVTIFSALWLSYGLMELTAIPLFKRKPASYWLGLQEPLRARNLP